jgi:hypothetical protein
MFIFLKMTKAREERVWDGVKMVIFAPTVFSM